MVSTGSRGLRRLLVANRGEIARRVFRTCRELGVETVAVHSDPDAGLPFVLEADVAVRLPGSAPTETYLRGDLVVAAALRAGADAVHPGYGFLSENADFARAVQEAGLTWVGPTPESMELMASKVGAKRLMQAAEVPVLPELDPAAVTADDLPVLVKASAGGGGRGMRVVRRLEELARVVEEAAAEAGSAFGDPTVFCEPYVEAGRHVEVQVWGDHGGREVSVLGARDCSVQRRHQKVVEEAPPVDLPGPVLEAMCAAARDAAAAISYVGVGTVEFLYDRHEQRFWFLEMNTRLQVEHPVTEAVTGLDLVRLQIAAAEDPGLRRVEVPPPRGHAIEVRLYAEDPAAGWQPQGGRLGRFEVPGVVAEFAGPAAYGIRLDSGLAAGDEVGTHYDAMLAKVVAWGPDRAEAARRLAAALRRARIHGVRTNRDLLVEVLGHPVFLAGRAGTAFLDEEELRALRPAGGPAPAGACLAAAVACAEAAARRRPVQQGVPAGWRNVASAPRLTTFRLDGTEVRVSWHGGRDGYRLVELSGVPAEARALAVTPQDGGWRVLVEQDGAGRPFDVVVDGQRVDVDSAAGHVALVRVPRFADPAAQVAAGSLLAPMPGSVVGVYAEVGQPVGAGSPVVVLEAMKMQHTVAAPHAGVVAELPVRTGDQVAAGDVLVVVAPDPSGGSA